MSRIGRKLIPLPATVKVGLGTSNVVEVQGPKGSLRWAYPSVITVAQEAATGGEKTLKIGLKEDSADAGFPGTAIWGLARSKIANMVLGVTDGFSKQLEIQGVGFKAQVQGKNLVLSLGKSHLINYPIVEGVSVVADPKQTLLTVTGIDKELVGQTAAQIRSYFVPEPYKGKGIRYVGEVVLRKAGKTAVAGAGAGGGAKK